MLLRSVGSSDKGVSRSYPDTVDETMIERQTSPTRPRGSDASSAPKRRLAACETSHGVRASSDVLVEGGPGGVFVVGAVGFEAAVEDADESVGELAQGGVVVLAAVGELVVIGPGRG
jgi:hypothetical protein